MWTSLALICLSVFVAEVYSECQDLSHLVNCDMLDNRFCQPPYSRYAKDVCPKTCGLCDENNSFQKRSHNHGPQWLENCWDNGSGHMMDPFCALLTTTRAPIPTTTTTTLPPTTTPRSCRYEAYNDSSIKDTDFGTDIQLVEHSNITLNESVHLLGDVSFCEGVCAQSLLNDGFECWAFTFNPTERCYLYYYSRPLSIAIANELNETGTTLYLKRCSDDPVTAAPPTTMAPATQKQTTAAPLSTATTAPPTQEPPTATKKVENTTKVDQKTTMSPMSTGTTTKANTGLGVNTQNPGGLTIVNTNSYKINGVPSPVKDTCYFLNQTFSKGDHWKDTCKFDCECINTDLNQALCTDICPHYTVIPSNCQIVTQPGQCCASLDCNGTAPNITDNGSGDGEDCADMNENCDYYPDSACQVPYVPWAKANCPLRCDLCPGKAPACVDRLSYCNLYDLDDACANYEGWARHNCRSSCNMCRAPGWNTNTF